MGMALLRILVRNGLQRQGPKLLQRTVFQFSTASWQNQNDPPPAKTNFVLPGLSTEQERARQVLLAPDGNVVINACAGSGKTTTILQMAKFIKKTFLVLLYNRSLKAETNERAKALLLGNIIIDNYHGLGYHYYSEECSTDQGLKRVVQDDMPPKHNLPNFDILVMDEQQDMNPIIFNFVQKLLRDAVKQGQKQPQIMLLGDPRQTIYQFNNADKRFLTLCRDLFPKSGPLGNNAVRRDWTELEHRTSFRLTKPIAKFINEQLLHLPKEHEILTIKNDDDNPKPRYITCDGFSDQPLHELVRLIEMGIPASEILVLGPSLRSKKNSMRHLANQLALRYPSIRIHVPTDDDEDISALIRLNKVIFASYHQAKGIEREAAIIFNFDDSYHRYFDRHVTDFGTVGNTQYVAVTRAKKHLVMLHHYENNYLPFIKPETLNGTCEVIRHEKLAVVPLKDTPKCRWAITDLTRNIPESVISKCFSMLNLKLVRGPNLFRIYPPTQVDIADDVWEGVAEITGTAVPAIYEWQTRFTCTFAENVFKQTKKLPDPLHLLHGSARYVRYIDHLKVLESKKKQSLLEIKDILFIANVSNMMRSKYINKVLSIPLDRYKWFGSEHAKAVDKMLRSKISKKAKYEKKIAANFADLKVYVEGCVDVMDYNKILELKWTNTLQPEHILQIALYGAIYTRMRANSAAKKREKRGEEEGEDDEEKPNRLPKVYRLIHVPTGQTIDVSTKTMGNGKDGFVELLRTLVKVKDDKPELAVDDEEFLKQAAAGFESVIGEMTVPAWLNTHSSMHKSAKRAKPLPVGSEDEEKE